MTVIKKGQCIDMSSSSSFQARLVVTGLDGNGRSTVTTDDAGQTRIALPTFTSVDLWQSDSLPTAVGADSTLGESPELNPPNGGLVVRVISFPPDSEWQEGEGYKEALATVGGGDANVDGEIAGLHETDTVDVLTVVQGEIYAVLEETETLLRQGDSLVQRGTKHAWSNRSDKPAILTATMISAAR